MAIPYCAPPQQQHWTSNIPPPVPVNGGYGQPQYQQQPQYYQPPPPQQQYYQPPPQQYQQPPPGPYGAPAYGAPPPQNYGSPSPASSYCAPPAPPPASCEPPAAPAPRASYDRSTRPDSAPRYAPPSGPPPASTRPASSTSTTRSVSTTSYSSSSTSYNSPAPPSRATRPGPSAAELKAQEEAEIARAIELSERDAREHAERLDQANMHMIFGEFADRNRGGEPGLFSDVGSQRISSQNTGVSSQPTGPAPFSGGFAFPEPQHTGSSFPEPNHTGSSVQPQFTGFDAEQAELYRLHLIYAQQQHAEAEQRARMQASESFLHQSLASASQYEAQNLRAQLEQQQRQLQEQHDKLEEAKRALEEQKAQCAMKPQEHEMMMKKVEEAMYASNNPFAPSAPQTPAASRTSPPPVASRPGTAAPPPYDAPPAESDPSKAHLAGLYANRGDGVDSFGNTGSLRFGGSDYGRLGFAATQAAQQQRA